MEAQQQSHSRIMLRQLARDEYVLSPSRVDVTPSALHEVRERRARLPAGAAVLARAGEHHVLGVRERDLAEHDAAGLQMIRAHLKHQGHHDLDEFILKEPATQATYTVSFAPTERNDMVGIPDFNRYKKREPHKANAESHATSERIVSAKPEPTYANATSRRRNSRSSDDGLR